MTNYEIKKAIFVEAINITHERKAKDNGIFRHFDIDTLFQRVKLHAKRYSYELMLCEFLNAFMEEKTMFNYSCFSSVSLDLIDLEVNQKRFNLKGNLKLK